MRVCLLQSLLISLLIIVRWASPICLNLTYSKVSFFHFFLRDERDNEIWGGLLSVSFLPSVVTRTLFLGWFHVSMRSGLTGSSRLGAPRRTCTLTRTLPKLTFGLQDPSGGILNRSKQILPVASSTLGWATGVMNLTIGGSKGYLKG